jgi:hypothetical protein
LNLVLYLVERFAGHERANLAARAATGTRTDCGTYDREAT